MDDVIFATPGAAEALVSFNIGLFLMQIKRNIQLRSTFAAYFNPGDGRRASFGVKVEVPRIARHGRLIDHLLEAIPLWASTVTRAADYLKAVFDAISDGHYSNAARAIEDLMSSLSSLALMGKQLPATAPFELKINQYRLTFILCDVFALLMLCLCRQRLSARDRRRHGCQCPVCNLVYRLRLVYQFVGPAPRNLFCALYGVPDADTNKAQQALGLLRRLVGEINTAFHCKLDLYAVELLPCSWLAFLRLAQRGETAANSRKRKAKGQAVVDDICSSAFLWKTNMRLVSESLAQRETDDVKDLFHILQQHALLDEFFAPDVSEQVPLMNALLSPRLWHDKFQGAHATQIIKAKVARSVSSRVRNSQRRKRPHRPSLRQQVRNENKTNLLLLCLTPPAPYVNWPTSGVGCMFASAGRRRSEWNWLFLCVIPG